MDLAHVTSIHIPEGDVVRITSGAITLWEKQLLPDGYVRLGWIESDGNQWIDTGIKPTQTMDFAIDFTHTSATLNESAFVFGARWTGSPTYDTYGLWRSSAASNGFVAYWGQYNADRTVATGITTTDIKASLKGTTLDVNGSTFPVTSRGFSKTPAYSIWLFAWNNQGATPANLMTMRLRSFSLSDGDTKVCELVPALRLSDEKPGMYDFVSGAFLTNNGSGEFKYAIDGTSGLRQGGWNTATGAATTSSIRLRDQIVDLSDGDVIEIETTSSGWTYYRVMMGGGSVVSTSGWGGVPVKITVGSGIDEMRIMYRKAGNPEVTPSEMKDYHAWVNVTRS